MATLHQLAREGKVEEAKAFLLRETEGATAVNAIDKLNRTPLHLAAWANHPQMVELLLKQDGCDVHAEAADFTTALAFAAQIGGVECCRLLLDAGARIDAKSGKGAKKKTPLVLAARKGHRAVVELLLDRGADLLASGRDAQTVVDQITDAATRELIEAASDRQQGLQQEVPEHETARGGAAQEGGTKRAAAEGDGSEPEVAKEVQKKKPKVALSFADDDVEDDSDLL